MKVFCCFLCSRVRLTLCIYTKTCSFIFMGETSNDTFVVGGVKAFLRYYICTEQEFVGSVGTTFICTTLSSALFFCRHRSDTNRQEQAAAAAQRRIASLLIMDERSVKKTAICRVPRRRLVGFRQRPQQQMTRRRSLVAS